MYVDAILDKSIIRFVERSKDGKRVYVEHEPEYYFYTNDKNGQFETIYGNKVSRLDFKNSLEYSIAKKSFPVKKQWESDINPVFRCIEKHYKHSTPPPLHIGFFDIEVDFDEDYGYSSATDATNKIISIAIHYEWLDKVICLALPPPTISFEEAQEIAHGVDGVILLNTEKELLSLFLKLIDDVDILSGWFSIGFDIPYVVNRIKRVLGREETKKLCLWNKKPKPRDIIVHDNKTDSYDLVGRIHLDYMELYKNYTFEEKRSYSLDAICEEELGEKKVPYNGTLDQLYKNDFKLFLEYNIQDTVLLYKLDKKLAFIDLTNNLAHSNNVLLPNTLGTVAMTDNAILIEAHEHNKIVPNKREIIEGENYAILNKAAGGWVSRPKTGLHKSVGSVDLNSLYPSTIRAFNMSPETIIGQIRLTETHRELLNHLKKTGNTFAGWWNDRFNVIEMDAFYAGDIGKVLTVDFEDGSSHSFTGKELRDLIFSSDTNWHITANGTIFTSDKEGLVPQMLSRWYNERKIMQKQTKSLKKLINGYDIKELTNG